MAERGAARDGPLPTSGVGFIHPLIPAKAGMSGAGGMSPDPPEPFAEARSAAQLWPAISGRPRMRLAMMFSWIS